MKIPCVDCISIAMCKSQLYNNEKSPWRALKEEVVPRCSDLVRYMLQDIKRGDLWQYKSLFKELDDKLPNELLYDTWRLFSCPSALSRLQEIELYVSDDTFPEPEERTSVFKPPFVNPSRRKDYMPFIPCKDCITFAMCNAIYIEYASLEGIFITTLRRKCSTAVAYIRQFEYPYAETHTVESQNEQDIIQYFRKHNEQ